MEEIWKEIPGYEGLYQVSNLGNARLLRYNSKGKKYQGKVVVKNNSTLTKNSRGYYCIKSGKKGGRIEIMIHRAVAQVFPEICGKWFDGCVVHHKDGNKENNKATNLIVLTEEEHQAIHNNDGITYLKVSKALKGRQKTKEEIAKTIANRRSYQGEGNPFYGKKHTEETKEKLRTLNIGKKATEQAKRKMSENSTKKRKVAAIKNGVVIKEFESIKEGANHFDLHPQNINQVLKGRCVHCGGYEWKYVS